MVPAYQLLLTGHFHEAVGYHTRRPEGSGDWLLVLTVSGQGRFGFENGEEPAGPGSFTLVAPGTPHDYGTAKSSKNWELFWTHFHPRPHWREWLQWPALAPGLMQLMLSGHSEHERIAQRFARSVRLGQSVHPQSKLFAMTALEETLLLCDTVNPLSSIARWDSRVRLASDYLCQNLDRQVSLSDLAKECNLSISRFSHLFRAQTGTTPQEFLEEQRMDMARQLLDMTNRPVHAVALAVGYENPFYFSARFKRRMGQSPQQYRRRRATP